MKSSSRMRACGYKRAARGRKLQSGDACAPYHTEYTVAGPTWHISHVFLESCWRNACYLSFVWPHG